MSKHDFQFYEALPGQECVIPRGDSDYYAGGFTPTPTFAEAGLDEAVTTVLGPDTNYTITHELGLIDPSYAFARRQVERAHGDDQDLWLASITASIQPEFGPINGRTAVADIWHVKNRHIDSLKDGVISPKAQAEVLDIAVGNSYLTDSQDKPLSLSTIYLASLSMRTYQWKPGPERRPTQRRIISQSPVNTAEVLPPVWNPKKYDVMALCSVRLEFVNPHATVH